MADPNPAGDHSRGALVLKRYWTTGPGRAKWVNSPHPWTTLRNLLLKHLPPNRANGAATQYYVAVFGHGPGAKEGKNPMGRG